MVSWNKFGMETLYLDDACICLIVLHIKGNVSALQV